MACTGEFRVARGRSSAWLFLVLLLVPAVTLPAAGFLVLAGQPRPALAQLDIPAGPGVRLDLILPAQSLAGADCRYTLYAIGGPLVAPVASKVVKLGPGEIVEGSLRIPVDMEIPAAAPGRRFLLKAEKVADARRELLAEAELRVVEQTPLAELRAAGAAGRIQVTGESRQLREFFSARQIPSGDEGAGPGPAVIALMEERPDDRLHLADAIAVVVVCKESPDAMLTVLARPSGRRWLVEAGLPHFRSLATATEAEKELAQVLHFADQLITNPPDTPPAP